jgi:hypothetical protein
LVLLVLVFTLVLRRLAIVDLYFKVGYVSWALFSDRVIFFFLYLKGCSCMIFIDEAKGKEAKNA